MKLWEAAAVGVGVYYGGRWALRQYRARRGIIVTRMPRTAAALQVAYRQAMTAVENAAARIGVEAQVAPGVVSGQPAVTVLLPPGVSPADVAHRLPGVSFGIPVHISGGLE